MDFSSAVLTTLNKAPEGWAQKLFVTEYGQLDDERKRYYAPVYAKYRVKKIRDYDPDCGHFVGWRPIEVGIGEPVGYKYVGYIAARAIDQINNSNVLMQRIFER